jgi:hypothetical protein
MNHVSGWLIAVLGDASPSPTPTSNEPDASMVSPGWLGFIFLAFLCVAVFVIWKSMNKQFKKIDFDEAATERPRKGASVPPSTVTGDSDDASEAASDQKLDGDTQASSNDESDS